MRQRRKLILGTLEVLVIGFIVIQFVGDFIDEDFKCTNPPVTHQIQWDSPEPKYL